MSQLDRSTLKAIAHKSNTSIRVMTFWAMKTRNAKDGILNVAKERKRLRDTNEPINDAEFTQLLKDLAEKGYGHIMKNGKGRITHFHFFHPMAQLGRAAIEGGSPVVNKKAAPAKKLPVIADTEAGVKTVVYCISNGHRVKIEFEGEISDKALTRIVDGIDAIEGSA